MFAACFGSVEEAEKEIAELMISQKEETIPLILECFPLWPAWSICKDLSEEESKSWDNYPEEQKR